MIKITADSTCDLSTEILDDLDISLMPLIVLIDNKVFRDGVDICPEDVFEFVETKRKTCKTSAVNSYEYECFFKEFASKYDAVIHICIGSGFSSCYRNATLAAEKFNNVYVIDSKNLSTGSGHVVYEAALMAREGADAESICHRLEELTPKVDGSFVIDHLDYLYKGGRCSGLEMFGAKMLQIRPCIEVLDGKMIVGKKYRGSLERCLEQYVKDRLHNNQYIDHSRIFVTHTMRSGKTVEKVKEIIRQYANFDEIIETSAGCTISSHCGPNTLGILFKRTKRKDCID